MDDKLFSINTGGWFSNSDADSKPACNIQSNSTNHSPCSDTAVSPANAVNTANNVSNSDSGSNDCGCTANNGSQSCCGVEANGAENMPGCRCVGYGYVPWQMLGEVYQAEQSLDAGTVFPELVLTIEEYGKVCKGGM